MEPKVLTGQLEQSEALVLPFTLLVAPRGQLFERRGRMCMRILYENTKITKINSRTGVYVRMKIIVPRACCIRRIGKILPSTTTDRPARLRALVGGAASVIKGRGQG